MTYIKKRSEGMTMIGGPIMYDIHENETSNYIYNRNRSIER